MADMSSMPQLIWARQRVGPVPEGQGLQSLAGALATPGAPCLQDDLAGVHSLRGRGLVTGWSVTPTSGVGVHRRSPRQADLLFCITRGPFPARKQGGVTMQRAQTPGSELICCRDGLGPGTLPLWDCSPMVTKFKE